MDKPTISGKWCTPELDGTVVFVVVIRLGTNGARCTCSEILAAHPWSLEQLVVVFTGHRRSLDTILHEKDRVEVYRPLKIDRALAAKIRLIA